MSPIQLCFQEYIIRCHLSSSAFKSTQLNDFFPFNIYSSTHQEKNYKKSE